MKVYTKDYTIMKLIAFERSFIQILTSKNRIQVWKPTPFSIINFVIRHQGNDLIYISGWV